MSAPFEFTPQAIEDLDAIGWFIAEDNGEAADRVEMEIVATCRRLTKHHCSKNRFQTTRGDAPMTGIQFVTDEKGRKVAVQIDLKKYGAMLEDFWDGLISESRRKEKGVPLEKIKAELVKRGRLRE
ncbi:MAG: type II toxin-antitoxin system RelE/ParE family toxin [Terriglobia bacterium]